MNKNNQIAFGIYEYDFPINLINKINKFIQGLEKLDWRNSGLSTNSINTKIRSSNELLISDVDPILNQKIKNYMDECAQDYASKYDTVVNTDVQLILLRYKEGGHYKYHCDSGPDFYRTVSFLIYINPSDYDGGETSFKFLDIKVKPDSPKIVFFPSSFMYTHAALPVTKGTKYAIVGWMNDILEV
jgi:predicted 2-oxoglutarate/Fe(II)-dependent dioxygenase YbiX